MLKELRNKYFSLIKPHLRTRLIKHFLARHSQHPRASLKAFLAGVPRRGLFAHPPRRSLKDAPAQSSPASMAYTGPASSEVREPGSRRKKFAEYLKAANDFRQTYLQGAGADPWERDGHSHDYDGTFPDASVVRSGNEEMILFPSYAKTHLKETADIQRDTSGNDAEYWQREWARHEDDNGLIDVEVRGWIYTPQRGPATRRQRLMIGLARQLSGIAAPPPAGSQRTSRPASPDRSQDEDLIAMEAEQIVQRGKIEAEFAGRGAFSETPGRTGTDIGTFSAPQRHNSTQSSDDSGTITPLQKRDSWSQPAQMGAAELAIANKHLLHRLRPFMATPLVESPMKAFFYNDTTAREKTVFTNPSGHFHLRTALDFVPTHVRVLAGIALSATEEVVVTPPSGVSLISDIDDTIKHSAISAGAREIFRNAFIRDLSDLTIEGVREWYQRLSNMGVKLHYVSNSPWQMYPILTTFFKTAGLPKGSFHLKQYSGMLQGIFEPVAERKKSSLDRIMRDFPGRKFILVGDSGEADLEVYTDVVLDNPGRVLGVFIRDVTTIPGRSGYFDVTGGSPGRHSRQSSRSNGDGLQMAKASRVDSEDADVQVAIAASLADMEQNTARSRRAITADHRDNRPTLPPRVPSSPLARAQMTASPEEDLIDLSDLQTPQPWVSASPWGPEVVSRQVDGVKDRQKSTSSPPPPKKPAALRGLPPATSIKLAPPLPRKPSSAVGQLDGTEQTKRASPLSQVQRQASVKSPPPLPVRRSYREMAKDKFGAILPSSALNEGVPLRQRPTTPRASTSSKIDAPKPLTAISPILGGQRHPDLSAIPELPTTQRRVGSSGSLASLRNASKRMSSSYSDDGLPSSPGEAGLSKKEFMWMQRLHKAKVILERQGVVLRTWRVGNDAQEACVRLVEMAQKEFAKDEKQSRH